MVSSNNNPGQLVLEKEHVHLIHGLLAAISLTEKTEKQSQAMHNIAFELGTILAGLQPCHPRETQLKTGAQILEWRVKEIERNELKTELRNTLNAINKASRDLILTHNSFEEYKGSMEKTNTRKRKREQFDELEQKFGELEQIRMKLKLSIPNEDDEQQMVELATATKPKGEPADSASIPTTVLRTPESSAVPEEPSIATKPSFSGPTCSVEAPRVSMPGPSSSSGEGTPQDLIDPKSATGPNSLSIVRSGERRYSYAHKSGVYKGVGRLPSPLEEGELVYNRSAERRNHRADDAYVLDTSRDPRLQRSVPMWPGNRHHG